MTRAGLLAAVRAWLKGWSADTALADLQVWAADTAATRPRPPYLSVRVTSWDERYGTDELRDVDDAGTLRRRVVGQRSAVVTVEAFGDTAAGWLEEAASALQRPEVVAATGDAGVTLYAEGPLVNLSALRDTSIEPRYAQDFRALYGYQSAARAVAVAETAEVAATYASRDETTHTLTLPLEESP